MRNPWIDAAARLGLAAAALAAVAAQERMSPAPQRDVDVEDFKLPDGYRVEPIVANLSVPTTIAFDGPDMLITESGRKNTAAARVLRVRPDGAIEVMAAQGLLDPVTGVLVHVGRVFVSHRGKVSAIGGGGALRDIVTGLPSLGDHQNNQLVAGLDGKIYLGQGTATNTGVVGTDNDMFGWLRERPNFHELPCQDVTLTGENFETANPLTEADDSATTGAYKPFGTPSAPGEVVKGSPRCGGSIVRFAPDGSQLEVVAWGLRNPFGLALDASGQLWATFHGADVRGSRAVAGDPDYLVKVQEGAWYGWPEFFDGEPVTASRFNAVNKPKPRFLWKQHPPLARAYATFAPHSGACGLAFSPGGAFGYAGDAFVALYGTFGPITAGVDLAPRGFSVQRVDMKTGEVHDFAANDLPGPAFINQQDGFNRPVDTEFGPDGALYVLDWGASTVDEDGIKEVPGTGMVWRIYRDGMAALRPNGPVVVERTAGRPLEAREPEAANVPSTWREAGPPVLLIAGAGAAVLLLVIVLALLRGRARRT